MRLSAMPSLPTYNVYSDDTSDGSLRLWNSSKSLHLALENVRVVRNQIINPYAGDPFVVDRILPTDPAYSYCNRIGQLRADPVNHWGYRFPGSGRDICVWIEKMPTTSGGAVEGSLQADLAHPMKVWAVARTTVG